MVIAFYRESGYLQSNVGQPNLKPIRDSKDGKTRFMTLEIPDDGRARATASTSSSSPATTRCRPTCMRPLFKMKTGDYYNEKRDSRRLREDPGNLRRGRPLRDDAVPGVRVRGRQGQRHDPDQRRQAVLHQPHHVPGQHDDARQRHPARAAALRKQRLQHRGAEVQRQAARTSSGISSRSKIRRTSTSRRRRAPTTRSTSPEARRAEPEPALVRRGRVAVRRRIRAAVVLDGELHGTRRDVHDLDADRARASATTRSRSPSRSCSIGRLPGRSMCTSATSSTSTSSRRARPGGNLTFGLPLANFSRFYVNYSYDRVYVSDLNEAFFDTDCLLSERRLPDDRLRQPHRPTACDHRVQPVSEGCAAHRRGWTPRRSARSRRRSRSTRSTIRSPRPRAAGIPRRWAWRASAATPDTSIRRSKASGSCGTRRGRRSACAPRRNTSGRSARHAAAHLRAARARRRLQRARLRSAQHRTQDPNSGIVIGGNKSLLFNAEYLISVAGPVRLILFYDAGQVQNAGEPFPVQGPLRGRPGWPVRARLHHIDGRRDPVLHAGAQRAVPADLCVESAAKRAS